MGAKTNGPNVFEGAKSNGRQNQVGAKTNGRTKIGGGQGFLVS
jgi:hypothetical protein